MTSIDHIVDMKAHPFRTVLDLCEVTWRPKFAISLTISELSVKQVAD